MRMDLAATAGVELPQGLEVYSAAPEQVTEEIHDLLAAAQVWALGDMEVGDLLRQHAAGRAHLFVGLRDGGIAGVMLTEFVQYPRKKVLVILALAGKVRQFAPFMTFIEHWAELNGCEEIEAYCREAMVRYAKYYGFAEVRRVIRKPVSRRTWQ